MKKMLYLMMITILLDGCSKSEAYKVEPVPDNFINATIVYSGALDVDGCGYLIKIDTSKYSPLNLSSEFQINNLEVRVDYKIEGNGLICGDRPTPAFKTIKINKIVRK